MTTMIYPAYRLDCDGCGARRYVRAGGTEEAGTMVGLLRHRRGCPVRRGRAREAAPVEVRVVVRNAVEI